MLPQGTPNILTAAFRQWTDAQMNLVKSIQSYVTASNTLESACASFHSKAFRGVATSIESDIALVDVDVPKLHVAQATLMKIRNGCIPPINLLPPEILSAIFTMVMGFGHPNTQPPSTSNLLDYAVILSGVCCHWRRVAYDTRVLWCSAQFVFKDGEANPAFVITPARLERTHGSPIDVLIRARYNTNIQTMLSILDPHVKQLRSFDLRLDGLDHVHMILGHWIENGVPGSLTELKMKCWSPGPLLSQPNSSLLNRQNLFIRPLRVLHLYKVGLHWDSVVFEQLEELFLSKLPPSHSPTVLQFAELLSTCPQLKSVELKNIQFRVNVFSRHSVAPPIAELKVLEVLNLFGISTADFEAAVSMLSVRQQNLKIHTDNGFDEATSLKSLRSLARRRSIHTLHLFQGRTPSPPLHQILTSLPDLKCLTLDGMTLSNSQISELDGRPTPNGSHETSALAGANGFPKITTLRLWNCVITNNDLFRSSISGLAAGLSRLELLRCRSKSGGDSMELSESLEGIATGPIIPSMTFGQIVL